MADSSPTTSKKSRSWREALRTSFSATQIYVLLSALLVLAVARVFYASMHLQTEHVGLWFSPASFDEFAQGTRSTIWSAPLDDVFIHYDFARSTARGFPFQWSEGNGYSSGGTSLLYPFVLALGYLFGYRSLALGVWAAIVAMVCTFALLLAARRLFRNLPPWTCLLAPPIFLATGVLDWALFSGMEVALFLSLWGLCFVLWDDLTLAIERDEATSWMPFGVGVACALLVASRPEAALLVGVFGVTLAVFWLRKKKTKRAITTLLWVGVPGALVMIAHLVANEMLTGDSSAAGALAKLELHHPYLTREQIREAWLFHIAYQVRRISEYHFSAVPFLGYIVWPLGLLSLVFEKTRRFGLLLWTSLVVWILVTALNGQVRWQNERYTMPAVAWLLLSVALGIGGAVTWAYEAGRARTVRWGSLVAVGAALLAFVGGESLRFREQVWFFGRASRNILEQHIRTGEYLRRVRTPRPKRVLVSDAGAIPYVSDLPAFDLIGLGGYAGLPIARASRQGVGAAVELIEHLPSPSRPDIMALYPNWWGTFVLWFGRPEHDFSVRGNVICGGATKVIYEPDWSSLEHSGEPFALRPGERVIDTLDLADVLSEEAHAATWDLPARGYVEMKMLPDPRHRDRDLWDAGRLFTPDLTLSFELRGFSNRPATLLLRGAPPRAAELSIQIDGQKPLPVVISPRDEWQEIRVPLGVVPSNAKVTLRVVSGDLHLFHVFAVDGGSAEPAAVVDEPKAEAPTAEAAPHEAPAAAPSAPAP